MEMDHLLISLMELAEIGKQDSDGPLARYYDILNTEVEKMYAFYLVYIYPLEQMKGDGA